MKAKNKRRYRSDISAAIHETMEGLYRIGAIDKTTMREFDESCLEPVDELTPAQIRALRKREKVSQPVFARYINVSSHLISDWERGVKKPGGPALRLLNVVRKHGLDTIA